MPAKRATLERMDHVALWVRDPAKAEEFYASLLGLKVVERAPDVGWLAVAPRGGGTRLALLVPDPGQPGYEAAKADIGGTTGIAFLVGDLKGTLAALKAHGVAIPWASLDPAGPGGIHATIEDQDGNLLMLFQPQAKAKGKPGLDRVGFVNVVVRDLRAAQAFYTTSLGLEEGETLDTMSWAEFRTPAKDSAAVGLLQPVEELYQEPDAYTADMAHIGESTGITFAARDLDASVAELRARGVLFPRGIETLPWGGRRAEFADPDGNTFGLVEAGTARKPRRAAAKKPAKKPSAKKAAAAKAKPRAGKAKKAAKGRKKR